MRVHNRPLQIPIAAALVIFPQLRVFLDAKPLDVRRAFVLQDVTVITRNSGDIGFMLEVKRIRLFWPTGKSSTQRPTNFRRDMLASQLIEVRPDGLPLRH